MTSNVREMNYPRKDKRGPNTQNGSKGGSPPKPVASAGPLQTSGSSEPRHEILKRPPGPPGGPVNVWTSNQHGHGSTPARARGGARPALHPPLPAQPVQILTSGQRLAERSAAERPAGVLHPTPPQQGETNGKKKDNAKRKPALKNMSIGDMIPAGTFPPKKGQSRVPSKGREVPPGASSASSAATRTVARRPLHAASEAPPGLDLAEFPALLPATASTSGNSGRSKDVGPARNTSQHKPPHAVAKRSALSPSAAEFHMHNPTPRPGKSSQPSPPMATVATLEPKPRDDASGDEHVLLRLMREGKFVVQNKGRQRIRPRRKKFSALKKRVLHERLQRWRELHVSAGPGDRARDKSSIDRDTCTATTVCLHGFVEPDELEDDDEYDEIITNLRDMAVKVGPIQRSYVPRTLDAERVATFVEFQLADDAAAAAACWDGLSLGGQVLQASLKHETSAGLSDDEWQTWCLADEFRTTNEAERSVAMDDDVVWEVVIDNALTDDDMEDDECLAESVADVKCVALRFGTVAGVRVEKGPQWKVYVHYEGGHSVAQAAAVEFCSVTMGGQALHASVVNTGPTESGDCVYVILDNVLSDDDLDDADCLQESLADIRELAQRYGDVKDVTCEGPSSRLVRISFVGDQSVAALAVEAFNSMKIGGASVTATVQGGRVQPLHPHLPSESGGTSSDNTSRQEPPGPMLSGDKRIPEQFAECLRAPKVPSSGQPRKYATLVENETVKPLLTEMLAELMRLQRRAMEEKNAKVRRRVVMGLREVARGIRAHKVKLVVMANNLDDYGVIDEKLQEIIDLAFEEGVPVFFEFSKRSLGKAVGKSIRVAVVGVQSAEGAHQQFKKLVALAPK